MGVIKLVSRRSGRKLIGISAGAVELGTHGVLRTGDASFQLLDGLARIRPFLSDQPTNRHVNHAKGAEHEASNVQCAGVRLCQEAYCPKSKGAKGRMSRCMTPCSFLLTSTTRG